MEYIFQQGQKNAPVFVLLHGTGGDEHSLLSIGTKLNQEASLLGIRGTVKEDRMNRYFRRLAHGIYDEEDLALQGKTLANFIEELAKKYQFSMENVMLVGYSNGANIAIHLMLNNPVFKKAILLHPMYPINVKTAEHLKHTRVFLTFGKQDPIVSLDESLRVLHLFSDNQANVTHIWTNSHQVTYDEITTAAKWLLLQ